jgi:hypothetical protein
MTDITDLHRALVARVRDGDGRASPRLRRAAFDNDGLDEPVRTLVDKVARHAYKVTAVRAAGHSEDEIFEIVLCAAIGQATRQYQAGLAALDAVTGES